MTNSVPVAPSRSSGTGSLRDFGAILLVSCYELGHQPLGIALPSGFLERAGFAPDLLDLSVEPFDRERVRRARFIGVSVPMHTALRLGVRAAERIRSIRPAAFLCFYGLYAWLNADYLLAHVADAVIAGEYEEPLVAFLEDLERGGAGEIEGVGRRERAAASVLKRLTFPLPSRERLPSLAKYAHIERDGARSLAGYVEASRGCLHHCLHCPIPPVYGGRFFVIPRETVLEDIRRQVELGATHITFGDPDFLNGPGHSLKLVRAVHAEFPELTFDFTAKVEHILKHRSLFREWAALGCVFVVTAVESLSDTVLGNLEKRHTQADVPVALDITRRAGIALRPSFVSFTPWTTLRDYLEVLDFVETEGIIDQVDPIQFAIRLLIPPGSALLSRPAIRTFLGPLDAAAFTYRWTHPDPRMDHLHQEVSNLVKEASRLDEDPAVTFYRIRALARGVQEGEARRERMEPPARSTRRPPRLTEPWFC